MPDGTHDVQGADDSRGTGGASAEHGLTTVKGRPGIGPRPHIPLIVSHCYGQAEPWYARPRGRRILRGYLWAVVAIVAASSAVCLVAGVEAGVWARGLFGVAIGAAALVLTREPRR